MNICDILIMVLCFAQVVLVIFTVESRTDVVIHIYIYIYLYCVEA